MLQKQWLLIGGEGHGQTIWIKSGNVVILPILSKMIYSGDEPEKPMTRDKQEEVGFSAQHYQGVDYTLNGSVFQIGVHNPTPDQEHQIPALIAEKKLKPYKSLVY